jgi:hypothetical protein
VKPSAGVSTSTARIDSGDGPVLANTTPIPPRAPLPM